MITCNVGVCMYVNITGMYQVNMVITMVIGYSW